MLVQHHRKYEEIHGEDEIVMITVSEHLRLHKRLRKEGKCTIPVKELSAISTAAHHRTEKYKKTRQKCRKEYNKLMNHKTNRIEFSEIVGPNIELAETINIQPNTGTITYMSRFRCNHKKKLKYIDI